MSCARRPRKYRNGKTFDQCKQSAEEISAGLQRVINGTGHVTWSDILEKVEHDELTYKLTLKYLRRDGYNIGDYKNPQVTR